ncbi:Glycerol-3-phosphate acyltransferase OS=Ureibacillus acetophenoni OX=614649 GN=plsY PE=3 SV=1 [Ureibacillus acetophenoni]
MQISLLLYITGAAVIIGHNFPFYMNFNGGKGTASVIGLLIMINWQLGLLAIFTFFLFAFLSNYLIIGVFQLYFILIAVSFTEHSIWPKVISFSLLLIALYLHIENIQRIRNGTEPKMSVLYKKESEKSRFRTNLPN